MQDFDDLSLADLQAFADQGLSISFPNQWCDWLDRPVVDHFACALTAFRRLRQPRSVRTKAPGMWGTRVADIYLTEFDRIFRHFYSRDAANDIAKHGGQTKFGLLDDSDRWTNDYFDPSKAKSHRREMFFANPQKTWQAEAAKDPDVFAGEGVRGSKGTKDGGVPVARAAARKKAVVKKRAKKKAAPKKKAKAKAKTPRKRTARKS
ncbi:hypothetical protein MTX25_09565 [Bradyrhizobium sp. ISRA432]|uniref:hypothetical protein n=1 Tax=unclassified Bradyrhizobium TaxID=2631580 RepID=UPI0024789054|nr:MULTISPECIES: hypothetical protein [unclassified Bradyrhizobium]WGR77891.1 hypothetical protein MTX21_34525 [Bradyrhizobium sp. ISRA430]WGR88294.1 hypothetical protein MTX25_09565 [Bradyrhizobium sp. ISRA432]